MEWLKLRRTFRASRRSQRFSESHRQRVDTTQSTVPFYLPPPSTGFLSTFPISSTTIQLPQQQENVQIEPEIAVLFKVIYEHGKVIDLQPLQFGAYNDCSVRRPNAKKISEKKNWGSATKGLSDTLIEIDSFQEGGLLDRYRIACYLHRENEWIEYGINSSVREYSYFYQKLLDWIIESMNTQSDQGPMENISPLSKTSTISRVCLDQYWSDSIHRFWKIQLSSAGDQSIVITYDETVYSSESILTQLRNHTILQAPHLSAFTSRCHLMNSIPSSCHLHQPCVARLG